MKLINLMFLPAVMCLLSAIPFDCSSQFIGAHQKRVAPSQNRLPDYILFGTYFGECAKHCAIMYRYNLKLKSNFLFVDSTDSYFSKRNTSVVFKSHLKSPTKVELARRLAACIPKQLITSNKSAERFGCPDCTDGGGIYIEFAQNARIKKFYIDYNTHELPHDIRIFAESVLTTIEEIKVRKE